MGLEKYGMTLFDGVFHEEQLACIEVNGIKRYLTGLNEFAPEIKLIKDPDAKAARIKEIRTVVSQLEQDLAAMAEFQPDLAIGTTPVVQAAKQASIPSLYFTNLISARPLMGPAGAGSLAQVINGAIANKARFDEMKAFFGEVGLGPNAGVWESVPVDRPEFKKETRRLLEKQIQKRKSEAMGT